MSDSPFFQFYPSDWLAGTRGLTAAETGIYITIIAMIYEEEGPINMDRKRLARLCGSTLVAFEKALAGLIDQGKIIETADGLWNDRARKEIKKRTEKRSSASDSANARWKKSEQKQEPLDANASETQCELDANQKPEPEEEKREAKASPKKRASRLPDDWFLPLEWGQWAVSEGLPDDAIRIEAEKFRDYWHARAGPAAAKHDWQATWRNWIRTALERKPQLTAIRGGKNDRQRFDTAHREYTRRIASGQIERGPDPSDPFAGR